MVVSSDLLFADVFHISKEQIRAYYHGWVLGKGSVWKDEIGTHILECAQVVLKVKRKSQAYVFISRPRVARAGTNKLKCQKNIPTGSHLTQMSAGVPNLNDFLNLNNFGQNGQN